MKTKARIPLLLLILLPSIFNFTYCKDRISKSLYYGKDYRDSLILKIDSLMQISKSNGILLIDNNIVKEWEYDKNKEIKIESQSITKSIVSLLLGIAIDEGKIKNINEKVYLYYPKFDVGPFTKDITFKHLVTISSGIEAKKYKENYGNPNNMSPGKDARYHNDHFHQLAIALTYIFEQPLEEVLQDRVLSKLNASVEWKYDGEIILENGKIIPVNAGYAFSKWNSRDISKIGQLFINSGKWGNDQLISSQYVKSSLTPIEIPLMISRPDQILQEDTNNTYGYGWRGIKLADNTVLWHMSGNGGQFCAIIPQKNIVFVKLNGHSTSYRPFRGLSYFKDILLKL